MVTFFVLVLCFFFQTHAQALSNARSFEELEFQISGVFVTKWDSAQFSLLVTNENVVTINSKKGKTPIRSVRLIPEHLYDLCQNDTSELKNVIRFDLFSTKFNVFINEGEQFLTTDYFSNDLIVQEFESEKQLEFGAMKLSLVNKNQVELELRGQKICSSDGGKLSLCAVEEVSNVISLELAQKEYRYGDGDVELANDFSFDMSSVSEDDKGISDTLLASLAAFGLTCFVGVLFLVGKRTTSLHFDEKPLENHLGEQRSIDVLSISSKPSSRRGSLRKYNTAANSMPIKSRSPSPTHRLVKYESLDIDI